MDDITQAVYDHGLSSSAIVAILGSFGGLPCFFTTEKVPAGAPRPYIWTFGNVADVSFESKDLRGRSVLRDLHCVCDKAGSADLVETLGRLVRDHYHRAVLNIGSGFTNYVTEATGPVVGTADPDSDVTSQIVTVRIMYQG